jgi:predicted permease
MNLFRKIRALFRKEKLDADMAEELRLHVERRADENVADGMSPEEARYAARRNFGGVEQIKEAAREQRGFRWLDHLGQDVRYGVRVLGRNPGFTLFALLTLALGIGANTAMFSVVNTVLLSALPVRAPQELVFLTDPNDAGGIRNGLRAGKRDFLSYPEFQHLAAHTGEIFTGVLAYGLRGSDVAVTNPGHPETHGPEFQALVSGSYFSVLGVDMILGRGFGPEVDQARDANPVAVVSYAFWQRRLGGDPAVLGRVIRINDAAFEIVGVARRGFDGETSGWPVAVWLPLSMQNQAQPGRDLLSAAANPLNNWRWLGAIARLRPDVTPGQAQAGIDVVFRQFLESQLTDSVTADRRQRFLDQHLVLTEGSRGGSMLRNSYSKPLVVLMALVGLLLLSACANLANLMLARAVRRQKEITVRVALGAKASRIFRQLLTESLLLSVAGGALGLLLAFWASPLLLRLVTQSQADVHSDARVMLFACAVSIGVGVLFGVAPALQAWRINLNGVLRGGAEGAGRTSSFPLGKVLVVLQVALSLPLLVIAGLFVHSLQRLGSVDLGYEPSHLLQLQADPAGRKGEAAAQFYRDLGERLRALPGVSGVVWSANGLSTGRGASYGIEIEGYVPPTGQNMSPRFDHVGAGYFSLTGIPVLRGREFGAQDAGNAERVGLINRTMARTYFGDTDPIGRRITVKIGTAPGVSTPFPFVIVGVVADAKYFNAREKPQPFYYVPLDNPMGAAAAPYLGDPMAIIKTSGNPAAAMAGIRAAVQAMAPNAPAPTVVTVNQTIGRTLGLDRALTGFSGFFGALATLLVSVGIYGIMAYAVVRRTREIGIRLAIGAQHGNVVRLIVGESLLLVLFGVAIGVPAAIGAGKFVTAFLFGLTPLDPLVLTVAAALMFLVAAAAAYFPARSATRIDPLIALRTE